MSFAWAFYSIPRTAVSAYFSGPCPEKIGAIHAALKWDEGALDDEAAEFVARHIASRGLNYSGLDEDQAALLDEALGMLTSPEGLAEALELKPESPDFVHPSVIDSLLRNAGAAQMPTLLLPILRSGRRFGAAGPTSDCNYCVLTPSEAGQLASELSAVLSATKSWGKEKWMPDLVTECLIGPLIQAEKADRHLLGLLG